ncbi:MAG: hypothetical protein ACOX5Y_04640 [Acholeplasmataceae bacterium]
MKFKNLSKRFKIIQCVNFLFVIVALLLYLTKVTGDSIAVILSTINFIAFLVILGFFEIKDMKRPKELRLLSLLTNYYNREVNVFIENIGLRIKRETYYGRKEEQPNFEDIYIRSINRLEVKKIFHPKFVEIYGTNKANKIYSDILKSSTNLKTYIKEKEKTLNITEEERKTFNIDKIIER